MFYENPKKNNFEKVKAAPIKVVNSGRENFKSNEREKLALYKKRELDNAYSPKGNRQNLTTINLGNNGNVDVYRSTIRSKTNLKNTENPLQSR